MPKYVQKDLFGLAIFNPSGDRTGSEYINKIEIKADSDCTM
jgi:hypothetical protein